MCFLLHMFHGYGTARECDCSRPRDLDDAVVRQQLRERVDFLRVARQLHNDILHTDVHNACAEDVHDVNDLRARLLRRTHLNEHKFTRDGVKLRKIDNFHNIDEL